MDDAVRLFGTGIAVGMHMGHHIVSQLPLITVGGGEVDVVDILAELLDLRGGYFEAKLGLGLRQLATKAAAMWKT